MNAQVVPEATLAAVHAYASTAVYSPLWNVRNAAYVAVGAILGDFGQDMPAVVALAAAVRGCRAQGVPLHVPYLIVLLHVRLHFGDVIRSFLLCLRVLPVPPAEALWSRPAPFATQPSSA